jgi:hypothetical protein
VLPVVGRAADALRTWLLLRALDSRWVCDGRWAAANAASRSDEDVGHQSVGVFMCYYSASDLLDSETARMLDLTRTISAQDWLQTVDFRRRTADAADT